jgi:ubiquitin-protein ligase
MRARRIENERLLLETLQQANSGRLRLTRNHDGFALQVDGVPALLAPPSDTATTSEVVGSHSLRVVFPRYYPSMPAEVYLDAPVFHPNVHPDTGFVCLWTRHRVNITLEQTLAQLQRVLAWSLLNTNPEHVMQPEALLWYAQPAVRAYLPLHFIPFVPVHSEAWVPPAASMRRRLS